MITNTIIIIIRCNKIELFFIFIFFIPKTKSGSLTYHTAVQHRVDLLQLALVAVAVPNRPTKPMIRN